MRSDPGTCQLKLKTCNRNVTTVLTFEDLRTGNEVTHRVCAEHATRLKLIDNDLHWRLLNEEIL
jgi:hypothetical protein